MLEAFPSGPNLSDGRVFEVIARWKAQPSRFVYEALNAVPDPWQEEALYALAKHHRVAVRSCRGPGKTTLQAWADLWFLFCFPYCRVPVTAPTEHQLDDILKPEIYKWLSNSVIMKETFEFHAERLFHKNFKERWFAMFRTATKPDALQGPHEDYILYDVEEASGVEDEIFHAVLGSLTSEKGSYMLMCGNPTKATGFFAEAFEKQDPEGLWFYPMTLSYRDSQRVSSTWVRMMGRKYGESSNVYRIHCLGLPPFYEEDILIQRVWVTDAMRKGAGNARYPVVVACDPARQGKDFSGVGLRVGNAVVQLRRYHIPDEMVLLDKILNLIRIWLNGGWPDVMVFDASGLGVGCLDRMRQMQREGKIPASVKIIGEQFGEKAHVGAEGVKRRRDELWFNIRELLRLGMISIKLDDREIAGELKDQLCEARLLPPDADNRLVIESKKALKRRGIASPDLADTVIMLFRDTVGRVRPSAERLVGGRPPEPPRRGAIRRLSGIVNPRRREIYDPVLGI